MPNLFINILFLKKKKVEMVYNYIGVFSLYFETTIFSF